MKKILALVLVLAVAQIASAAVMWQNTDNGDGTFTVSLVADENVASVQIGQMLSSGSTFAVSPLEDSSVWAGNFGTKEGFYDLAAYSLGNGYGFAQGINTAPNTYAIGTLLSFTVTGTAGDVITVQNYDGGGYDTFLAFSGGPVSFDSYDGGSLAQFTLVPEPMTMALLGLGGLFIRRRRA